MSEHTLPGDIPGLLRRGSPVHARGLAKGCASVVVSVSEQEATIGFTQVWKGGTPWGGDLHEDYAISQKLGKLALDLSDPTGRAHAWAYLSDNGGTLWWGDAAEALGLDADLIDRAVHHAMRWVDMTPGEIDILRRVVLHVAGREVTNG